MRQIQHGNETMLLHPDGCITRPQIGMNTPSGQWRVVGAVQRNNFGAAVRYYSLAEILKKPDAIPWRFKNGAQRVFVRDFDHGTTREWHSPQHSIY